MADAVFSDDGGYRYVLTRVWNRAKPICAWVMLNPSTAGKEDDNTIRRVVSFSRDNGFGAAVVVNLCALVSTDPNGLRKAVDPAGRRNEEFIRYNCAERVTVCAWGSLIAKWQSPRLRERVPRVLKILREIKADLRCLLTTKDGHPMHPLRLPGELRFKPYPEKRS